MSSDIVYQMDLFTDLFKSTPETDEVIAAKAKKVAITEKCAADQSAVDKELKSSRSLKMSPLKRRVRLYLVHL